MAKIGDRVRFLNSTGGGTIVRIEGNIAHVEDEDGFDVPVLLKECVVVMEASDAKKAAPMPESNKSATKLATAPLPQHKTVEPVTMPVMETAEGDKLNVVVAFESDDLKRLSASNIEITLVNDSNYYLGFVFASRRDDEPKWTLRKTGTVEPNMMFSLGNVVSEEIGAFENIMLQYVAYKSGKSFEMKPAVSVEHKVDTTKFFKLHCFRDNIYFDNPVIAFDIVRYDKVYTPVRIDKTELEKAIRQKKSADRVSIRPVNKRVQPSGDILEVNLHIDELVDNTNGLSRSDMLNLQIDEFRRVMDENIKNHGKKIVFIHGKGEGVLRQAILKELNYRYKGHDVCDASFREYGFGATRVTIK